ncbi:MAG TPA: NEW3 domain-containing protein [Thermoanaerobaculia bacterium]|nr:NEW3 domain-containing protein [Thermoanaerobaculia bacterium]
MTRRLRCFVFIAALCSLFFLAAPGTPQGSDTGTESQRRIFELRRRQVELVSGRTELERTQQLFDQGLASRVDLERAKARFEALQIAYQEAVLSLVSLAPRVTIERAVKLRDARGRQFVRLTVANRTPTFDDQQYRLLNDFEGAQPIPDELRTRNIRDIFVSLQEPTATATAPGITIGLPYEQQIPSLKYGEHRTLVFQLLRDVPSVVVALSYLGQRSELAVQLQQSETGSALNISSTQISQEADLGSQLTYSLRLERSSVDVRSFSLLALGLPRAINYNFVEPGTKARLSQLNFPPGVTAQNLELQLFLPDQGDEQLRIDQPIDFWAVAADTGTPLSLPAGGPVSREELERLGVGFLRLMLTPRGVGRIDVSALSLFSEIEVGETVRTELRVRNTGTRGLDNVVLSSEAPSGWKVSFSPEKIARLDLRQEAAVQMSIEPPESVVVGDYEVRVKPESFAFNRRVSAEDKVFRVSVKQKSSPWLIGALVLVLLGVLLWAIRAGIRLTRR